METITIGKKRKEKAAQLAIVSWVQSRRSLSTKTKHLSRKAAPNSMGNHINNDVTIPSRVITEGGQKTDARDELAVKQDRKSQQKSCEVSAAWVVVSAGRHEENKEAKQLMGKCSPSKDCAAPSPWHV